MSSFVDFVSSCKINLLKKEERSPSFFYNYNDKLLSVFSGGSSDEGVS